MYMMWQHMTPIPVQQYARSTRSGAPHAGPRADTRTHAHISPPAPFCLRCIRAVVTVTAYTRHFPGCDM